MSKAKLGIETSMRVYARASHKAVYAHSALITAQTAYDIAAEDERLAWLKVAAAKRSNNEDTS